jgi:hypothetical protein
MKGAEGGKTKDRSCFSSLVNMRVLIDTNIAIYREDNKIVSGEIQNLSRLMAANQVGIVVHPSSRKDILRDADEDRKKIMLSKIGAYETLKCHPILMRTSSLGVRFLKIRILEI